MAIAEYKRFTCTHCKMEFEASKEKRYRVGGIKKLKKRFFGNRPVIALRTAAKWQ